MRKTRTTAAVIVRRNSKDDMVTPVSFVAVAFVVVDVNGYRTCFIICIMPLIITLYIIKVFMHLSYHPRHNHFIAQPAH